MAADVGHDHLLALGVEIDVDAHEVRLAAAAQVRARDMVVSVELQGGERVEMPGNPVKLSHSQAKPFQRPPGLGEHTESVLGQLMGYGAERIAELKRVGAIA